MMNNDTIGLLVFSLRFIAEFGRRKHREIIGYGFLLACSLLPSLE